VGAKNINLEGFYCTTIPSNNNINHLIKSRRPAASKINIASVHWNKLLCRTCWSLWQCSFEKYWELNQSL